MAGENSVTLIGNLTRDPELRYLPSGAAQVTFGLAVNRRWQNRQTNEWEEATSFFNVVAWRDLAENIGESFRKGMRVIVVGRLEQRSWETQEGEKRSVVEVVADEVGPSIRWATVEVTRNERSGGTGAARPPRAASSSSAPASEPEYDPFVPGGAADEEPF